ncbi:hypothetical protein NDU88_000909 [Pleurodeles waltl]|uniref:Uncharacterized protein n=1 Tax=Pleurodeles waltl TaxID=8319 RepID=A0AAV7LB84_PLEWA|nr:hypothetical protein NDU88_000909 [Pleurodeles waltl]
MGQRRDSLFTTLTYGGRILAAKKKKKVGSDAFHTNTGFPTPALARQKEKAEAPPSCDRSRCLSDVRGRAPLARAVPWVVREPHVTCRCYCCMAVFKGLPRGERAALAF